MKTTVLSLTRTLSHFRTPVWIALAGIALFVIVFEVTPLPGGDDWGFFRNAVHRMLAGQSLYSEPLPPVNYLYHYPPWIAALLILPGILPFRMGWGLVCGASFVLAILLVRRYEGSLLKQALVLLSPPMFYIILHGQIDVLVLSMLFLPKAWWLIASISKPQVTLALALGIPRKYWIRAGLTAIGASLVSFAFFGLWPLEIIHQPKVFASLGLNIWGGLWPYQVPLGLVLVFRAWQNQDERFLIAASPFFMPYATTSTLIGPWIALCTLLKDWQAAVVLAAWWAAAISRLL